MEGTDRDASEGEGGRERKREGGVGVTHGGDASEEESHGSYYYNLSLIVSLYFISSLRVWLVRQLQCTSIISNLLTSTSLINASLYVCMYVCMYV